MVWALRGMFIFNFNYIRLVFAPQSAGSIALMGLPNLSGCIVDFDLTLFADTARRRRWLLTKAMEHSTLGEALCLAQAAEAFVTEKHGETRRLVIADVHQGSTLLH
jgi:hypothetical protein